jgi:FkbM family methyltransferase
MKVTDEGQYPDLVSGAYEKPLQDAMVAALKPGHIFFDAGAHTGLFALLASRCIGASGNIVAFEPHPVNAKQLRVHLAMNSILNCRVVQAAVSDTVGSSHIHDMGQSTMFQLDDVGSVASGKRVRVPTTTLDAEAAKHGFPDVVKVDVEGAELLVLQGANRVLSEKKPILFIEVHTEAIARELYTRLAGFGYSFTTLAGESITDLKWHRFVVARCGWYEHGERCHPDL